MRLLTTFFVASAFAWFSSAASSSAAEGLPNAPYIYVEGSAEKRLPADSADIRLEVSVLKPSAAQANEVVQNGAKKVWELLAQHGVETKDVVAGSIESSAIYEDLDRTAPGKLIGYKVTRDFSFTVRKLDRLPALLQSLVSMDTVALKDVASASAEEKKMMTDAKSAAMKDARAKADEMIKDTGMKISGIWSISPVAQTRIVGQIFGSEGDALQPIGAGPDKKTNDEWATYRLADVSTTQSVHVIYLLASKE